MCLELSIFNQLNANIVYFVHIRKYKQKNAVLYLSITIVVDADGVECFVPNYLKNSVVVIFLFLKLIFSPRTLYNNN